MYKCSPRDAERGEVVGGAIGIYTTPDARAAEYLPGAVARAESDNAQHPRPDAQGVMSELLLTLSGSVQASSHSPGRRRP